MTIGNISANSRPAASDVCGQFFVDPLESAGLVRFTTEGPDNPHPGDLLSQDPVGVVQSCLHPPELRHQTSDHESEGDGQDQHADDEQPRHPRVLAEGEHDTADNRDGRGQHCRASHHDQ